MEDWIEEINNETMNVQTIEKLNNIEDSNEEINNPKDNDNMEDSIEEINDSIETESSNEYSFFEQGVTDDHKFDKREDFGPSNQPIETIGTIESFEPQTKPVEIDEFILKFFLELQFVNDFGILLDSFCDFLNYKIKVTKQVMIEHLNHIAINHTRKVSEIFSEIICLF